MPSSTGHFYGGVLYSHQYDYPYGSDRLFPDDDHADVEDPPKIDEIAFAASGQLSENLSTEVVSAVTAAAAVDEPPVPDRRYWALVLLVFPVLTVFGNVLVVLSVVNEKSLRSVTNFFIVSLAIADIMVAILVMPLAVYVEVNVVWGLGDALCDAWVAFDVMCCTASILNLTAISIDRFIAVTRPLQYAKHRFSKRVHVTLAATWIVSAAVSSPIVLGWNYTDRRRSTPQLCTFYNAEFLIYSSMASFYIPCIAMILLYCKTLRVILDRAARNQQRRGVAAGTGGKKNGFDLKTGAVSGATKSPGVPSSASGALRTQIATRSVHSDSAAASDSIDALLERFRQQRQSRLCGRDEMYQFTHGHFRTQLYQTAVRRLLLRLNPRGSWLPGRFRRGQAGNGSTSTYTAASAADLQIPLLVMRRRRNQSTTASDSVQQSSVEQEAARSVNDTVAYMTTDAESAPLTVVVGNRNRRLERIQMEPRVFSETEEDELERVLPASNGSSPKVTRLSLAPPPDYHSVLSNNRPNFEAHSSSHATSTSLRLPVSTLSTSLPATRLPIAHHSANRTANMSAGGGSGSNREKHCGSRERKATKTLAIVLGVFLLCWVPFFTLNIINAVCIRYDLFTESAVCNIHPMAFSLFVWLGYINSFLNPVIYTIFNVEFRKAFKKLLQHPCS